MIEIKVYTESWPIRGKFTISRGAKTEANVVVVELRDGAFRGYGECVPYARYGESCESVMAQIESLAEDIRGGMDQQQLQSSLAAGAARNAVDCAMWDLQAKRSGKRVAELLRLGELKPLTTAYTLSLDSPENMHQAALDNAFRPLLKLKLAGEGDIERVQAVHSAAPNAQLVVDANEGWDAEIYQRMVPQLQALGVSMIEQPLPAGNDELLRSVERPITICADESCHASDSLAGILGKYDMINIKLDKTGGLTEAIKLRQAAETQGLQIMVGCMLATSLAMAPAMLVAQDVAVVDLDGPLLLERDRQPGLKFSDTLMFPPEVGVWG
jgi:L-Ala-D/L-Glu epimerase